MTVPRLPVLSVAVLSLTAFLGSLMLPQRAEAALMFCNRTKVTIEAALGYRENETWYSEGWWQIKPGLCVRTYSPPLTQRFYFYYARTLGPQPDGRGPLAWEGKYAFCIDNKAFHIKEDSNCEKRGHKTQGFHEIDIGQNVRDYTLNF